MNSIILTHSKSYYQKTKSFFSSFYGLLIENYKNNWSDFNFVRYVLSSTKYNSLTQTLETSAKHKNINLNCAEFKHVSESVVMKDYGIQIKKVYFQKYYSPFTNYFYLIKIDPRKYSLSLDIPGKLADVKRWCKENKIIAGINGGFYEKGYSPSGILKHRDKLYGSYNSKLSGIVLISHGTLDFIWNHEIENIKLSDVDYLIQSGPFLIEPDYKEGIYNNDKKLDRRTTIGKDIHGNIIWAIVPTKSLSLYEFMKILRYYNIKVCVNLDGGASTSFYFSECIKRIYVPPLRKVPFIISLYKR